MPSAFSHAFTAFTFSKLMYHKQQVASILLWGIFCSVVPDADVITFKLGYEYSHFLGHRGFFHSFSFCIMLAFVITLGYYFKQGKAQNPSTQALSTKYLFIFIFLSLCGCSHGILDAMTNGGLGVALFAPFDNSRYFLPFRPIQVSPIGIERFFSVYGLKVVMNELRWVFLPCSFLLLLNYIFRKK